MSVYSQHDVYVLLYLAIICVGAAIVIAILGVPIGRLMDRRDARHQLDDEYAALDHGEPSRRAVERGMAAPTDNRATGGPTAREGRRKSTDRRPSHLTDVERAAMDALARAEAERDLDQFGHDCEAAFLDAMTAGRPYLRAIRDAQDEARSLDAEWAALDRAVSGGGS